MKLKITMPRINHLFSQNSREHKHIPGSIANRDNGYYNPFKTTNSNLNETPKTDFNSYLFVDGTLFTSHFVITLSLIDLEKNKTNNSNNNNKNNQEVVNDTTHNTNISEDHRIRQTVNSTELTQYANCLITTLPLLPNINKTLLRLQRQKSVHFNNEPVVLNTFTRPTLTNNQNILSSPQQLVNFVRQINSQNDQPTTNDPTPYYL